MQGDVLRAVGAHVQEGAGGLADRRQVLDALVVKAEERGDALGVEAGRRGDVLLEGVGLRGHREEVEDPAAGVVDEHHGQRQLQARGAQQGAEIVGERDVAKVDDDPRAAGRGAEGRGERAVDAVGAAVGEGARRGLAHGPEGLDVAHRHRGGAGPVDEFRDMVKALHRAGLEVILDVVFNHTAEGDHRGPTLSFRGLDNSTYYILEADRARYANYSGTGNTLNANQPIVRRMILDSLRYWAGTMHVDGFRFDLASILDRDESGAVMPNPPVLWDIESEPALAGTKLIAEAWDAAGLYQVGSFGGDSWKEWNGRFRDDVRDFFRGEEGVVGRFADRLVGSPSLYGHKRREPEQSVNFVTCHDGFTLNDLVSYDVKHNEANRENNRDGTDDNRSWNCGVEGPTEESPIDTLRTRQVKNFLTVAMLAPGMPMLLMGDEVRRTQRGNNNAYCQDNEISWFDWTLVEPRAEVLRFVRLLNASRVLRDLDHERRRVALNDLIHEAELVWHGVKLDRPDWSTTSHSVAFTARFLGAPAWCHVILNAYWEALDFELPGNDRGIDGRWVRWIDTFLPSPHDIVEWGRAPVVDGLRYRAQPRSVVVLFAEAGSRGEATDGSAERRA